MPHASSPTATLLPAFAAQANLLGADVVVTSLPSLPSELRSRIQGDGGGVAVSEELAILLPQLRDLGVSHEEGYPKTAVTLGVGLVAATGSVLLAERTRQDRLLRCAALRHLVVVPADTIMATMADAAVELCRLVAGGRRYATFVSGPSRTGDIERVLTIGVHGPQELIVFAIAGWTPVMSSES